MPMCKVYVVVFNRAFRNEIERLVEELLPRDVLIIPFINSQVAFKALANDKPDLMIIDDDIPNSYNSSVDIHSMSFFDELGKLMECQNRQLPRVILLTDDDDCDAKTNSFIGSIKYVQKQDNFNRQFRRALTNDYSKETKYQKNLVFNIRIQMGQGTWDFNWEMWQNNDVRRMAPHPIKVDVHKINEIKEKTRLLDALINKTNGKFIDSVELDTLDTLKNLGRSLADIIIKDLDLSLANIRALNADLKVAAYRFFVDESSVGLVLESTLDAENNFLFLKAPIFRSLGVVEGERKEYITNIKSNLRCRVLIINSDASGSSAKFDSDFEMIGGSLSNECEMVKDQFSNMGAKFVKNTPLQNHESVVLSTENYLDYGHSFKEALVELLESRVWDVVHYAGHSAVIKDAERLSNRAFLILPGNDGGIEELSVRAIKPRIKFVGLLFLSSCRSGNEFFSLELSEGNIARFIGYRWRVATEDAILFSQFFYKYYLEKNESAPAAFSSARSEIFHHHENSTIWASPILCIGNTSEPKFADIPVFIPKVESYGMA